jgi:hypothetical protein
VKVTNPDRETLDAGQVLFEWICEHCDDSEINEFCDERTAGTAEAWLYRIALQKHLAPPPI